MELILISSSGNVVAGAWSVGGVRANQTSAWARYVWIYSLVNKNSLIHNENRPKEVAKSNLRYQRGEGESYRGCAPPFPSRLRTRSTPPRILQTVPCLQPQRYQTPPFVLAPFLAEVPFFICYSNTKIIFFSNTLGFAPLSSTSFRKGTPLLT